MTNTDPGTTTLMGETADAASVPDAPLFPVTKIDAESGSLKQGGPVVTIAEMDAATAAEANHRHLRE